jgi:hypothetical protein
VLAGASWWFLPDASLAYVRFARDVLPDLPAWLDFPLWNLHTIRGFARLLVSNARLADGLALVATIASLVGFVRARQRLGQARHLDLASAVVLSLLVSPHAMIYDWALLVIPAVIVWRAYPEMRPRWLVLFAAVWIAALVSGPLTLAQQRVLPFAVQVSVPVLFASAVLALRWLALTPAAADPAWSR